MRSSNDGGYNKRLALRFTTIGLLGAFVAQAAVPDARAADVVTAHSSPRAAHVAKKTPPKTRTKTPAETYPERQKRIGESTRSLLPPLHENEGKDTTCVSAEFTTLSVVYDSIVEQLAPSLPASAQAALAKNRRDVQRWMRNVHVSTLAVSSHPYTRGADGDDPSYRSPISQLVVENLLKIRDGKQDEAIPVANITLSQAVESAWLYTFVGVLAPLKAGTAFLPGLGSPFTDTPLAAAESYVTHNVLISLALTGSQLALQYLYQGTSSAVLNQCVARVTDEQKAQAGRPSDRVRFDIPIHPLLQGAADQLALADADTCAPIGDQSLGRILRRTADYAKATAPNAAAKRRIDIEATTVLRQMKRTPVPHNLIPADPADFSTAETIASFVGSLIPYVGGAPLDIAIGLGHNIGQGDDLSETVSAYDLTVTKSLTAAYYSYYFALYLFTTVGALLVEPVRVVPGTEGTIGMLNPIRPIGMILGLPLTYGLVTFHNVVRSMCFREDDTTGTGLGAEANRVAPEKHDEAVEKAKTEKAQAEKTTRKQKTKRKPTTTQKPAQKRSTPTATGRATTGR
ncbi:MAG: hypothetical protein QM774_02285 [Gordonia sp. (in: high G+C Gram-positive bacteria)]|uniref:hypothetical protein n=1 Tax=Gordonia sp. (in: high G+C Gram-positive bacteria) TaxID=84139 RepID=UPI0039E4B3FF